MLITFTNRFYLFALFLLPVLVLLHFYVIKRVRSTALKFANFEAISKVRGIDMLSKNLSILILNCIIIILLTFSLAGVHVQRTVPTSAFSFALAIDASQSMEATDFHPNRLEAAKETASLFVDGSPSGTKFAIISFSGNSFIEQDITNNRLLIKQAIKNIPLSSVGGTDLNEAVITSTNLLEGEEAKAIILLSDGKINVGTVDDLIQYANKRDIIIHTIAMGTEEGGETTYGLSKADKDSLKGISFNTGGKFFEAPNKESLVQSFGEISELKIKNVSFDISWYLLIASMILIIINYLLSNTRYRVIP